MGPGGLVSLKVVYMAVSRPRILIQGLLEWLRSCQEGNVSDEMPTLWGCLHSECFCLASEWGRLLTRPQIPDLGRQCVV